MKYILDKNGKKQVWRHGEVFLVLVDSIPKKGVKKSISKTFMVGSHGHNHDIDNGEIYFLDEKEEFVFGYLKAKNTNLIHEEHKDETGSAKIPDGNYQLIKQQEITPKGLIPIRD